MTTATSTVSLQSSAPVIYAIATLDTKAEEIQYVVDALREAGEAVCLVDVSTGTSGRKLNAVADINRETVASQ